MNLSKVNMFLYATKEGFGNYTRRGRGSIYSCSKNAHNFTQASGGEKPQPSSEFLVSTRTMNPGTQ
jgi:hypothetical protein